MKQIFLFKQEGKKSNQSIRLSQEQINKLEQIADSRGISRASLLRQFLWTGYRVESNIEFDIDAEEEKVAGNQDPYESIFADHLANSENDAITIEELKEKMLDNVEKEIMELYRTYDKIELVDGKIYEEKQ